MRRRPLCLLATLLIFFRATSVVAADECTGPSSDCIAVGRWNFSLALGAGIRTNPVVHGANIPLVVIPQFSYYGKRFFIENLDLGFTLAEGKSTALSLIASPGYDRVFFYRSDLQNIFVGGLPGNANFAGGPGSSVGKPGSSNNPPPAQTPFPSRPRHVTYLAGPEWTFKYHRVSGQLDLLHEITGQNHGNEIRAALAVPLSESRNPLTASFGITWKSAAIVNYYYGAPHIYEGGSAVNPFFKLGYTRHLTGKWRLTVLAHYERLGEAIADSPIVSQRYVATVFAGTEYQF
jgi:outer membrane protein